MKSGLLDDCIIDREMDPGGLNVTGRKEISGQNAFSLEWPMPAEYVDDEEEFGCTNN